MKRPSEPDYEAKGTLAKKIVQDLQTPATKKELDVVRKVLESRKKRNN